MGGLLWLGGWVAVWLCGCVTNLLYHAGAVMWQVRWLRDGGGRSVGVVRVEVWRSEWRARLCCAGLHELAEPVSIEDRIHSTEFLLVVLEGLELGFKLLSVIILN